MGKLKERLISVVRASGDEVNERKAVNLHIFYSKHDCGFVCIGITYPSCFFPVLSPSFIAFFLLKFEAKSQPKRAKAATRDGASGGGKIKRFLLSSHHHYSLQA